MNEESEKKKFIGIMFECCNAYARIYKNAQGTHYTGACPRCMRRVSLKIGEGGTEQRFFRAK